MKFEMSRETMDPAAKESPINLAMEDIQKALASLSETVEELTSRTTQIRNSRPSTKDAESEADPPPQPSSTLTSKLRDCNKTINIQTARLAMILSELDI